MKRFHIEILLAVAVLLLAGAALLTTPQQAVSQAAGQCKIGYVDFQKVLDTSVEGKRAQGQLEKKFGDQKNILEKKAAELKQLEEEISKTAPVITQIALEEKKNMFQAKYKSYLQQKMMLQENYNNEFVKLVSPMQKELNKIIMALGKERAYTMIFKYDVSARTDESVLAEYLFFPSSITYFDPGMDVTTEVLKRYDAAHKK